MGYLSRYLHTDHLRQTLSEEGYLYHLDDYSDDFPRWERLDDGTNPIVVLPYVVDNNDMKFWLDPSFTTDIWVDYAKATFDALLAEPKTHGEPLLILHSFRTEQAVPKVMETVMGHLTGKQTMALRNLLGAIILADGRIVDDEITAYSRKLSAVLGHQDQADREARWFLNRVDEIRDRMASNGAKNWLAEQIAILRTAPSIADLLDAIWSVAVSDNDLHPKEADILDFAFSLWIRDD